MVDKSGGFDEEGRILNDSDYSYPYNFIINSEHKLLFNDAINSLPLLISNMKIFEAYPLILESEDDPYWSKVPNHRQISALELVFGSTSIAGSLSTVSLFQNKILQYERRAYEKFLLDELDSLRNR